MRLWGGGPTADIVGRSAEGSAIVPSLGIERKGLSAMSTPMFQLRAASVVCAGAF
jgi:hypothetical protein